MDSLFIMERYWGSEEDNSEEEKCNFNPNDEDKISKKKQKLDAPLIIVDSEQTKSSHKKKKLDSDIVEINSDDDFIFSDSKQSNNSDSDVEILNDIKVSSSSEHNTYKTSDLNEIIVINKIEPNTKKEQKLKHKKYNEFSSKINDVSDTINSSNLPKNIKKKTDVIGKVNDDNKIQSKLVKKQKLKDVNLQESNKETISQEHDVSNMMVNNSILSENSSSETAILNGSVNDKVGLKIGKKYKLKDTDFKKSNEETTADEYDFPDSEKTENVGEAFCTIGQVYHQKDLKIRHALPQWLSKPTFISVNLQEEETPISELNYLDSNTKKNLKDSGINFLFPVQFAVIPWLMQSKEQGLLIRPSDICVSAPTGSGKTLAFVLPIVQSLQDRVVCAIRALIVLPVSELAIQVFKVFETFVQGTDLKVALLTGKKSFAAEQNALVKSDGGKIQSLVDIVVTTPGRIHDHIYKTKGFCLKRLRYLVIDEADRMMEEIQQGWLKQMEDAVFHDCIFSDCVCSSYKRTFYEPTCAYNFGFISYPLQKLLYSATLTHDPEQLHSLSLYKPKLFTASSVNAEQEHSGSCTVPSGLKMLQVVCEEGVKPMVICHLVKHYNFKRVLCFTETIERAHRLHLVLEQMGLQVREISSFNRAIQRKIVLEQFSMGKVDILVCSDLVARGIDIQDIDCVISYDVPQYIKIYIHRIGRTARAGKTGTAITLLSEEELPHFKKILKPAGIELPEKVNISSDDLKPFVNSYQVALSVTDTKLKEEKNKVPGRPKKRKRKLK